MELNLQKADKNLILEPVNSAEKALELIQAKNFDCIVSNYVMPWMNGIELCTKIRTDGSETPFILFTSQDEEKVINEADAAGIDLYMEKEPNLGIYEIMAQNVRNLVKLHREDQETVIRIN